MILRRCWWISPEQIEGNELPLTVQECRLVCQTWYPMLLSIRRLRDEWTIRYTGLIHNALLPMTSCFPSSVHGWSMTSYLPIRGTGRIYNVLLPIRYTGWIHNTLLTIRCTWWIHNSLLPIRGTWWIHDVLLDIRCTGWIHTVLLSTAFLKDKPLRTPSLNLFRWPQMAIM